jgi:molybdopterin molybdotransferase
VISFDEALEIVLKHSFQPKSGIVPISECCGRVLAEDLVSTFPSPAFDNSAVDGYALGSIQRNSWQLVGCVPAGDTGEYCVASDEAMQIFTGARTPKGTEAILMQEDALVSENTLTSSIGLVPSSGVRKKGEDYAVGTKILAKGETIRSVTVGEIAALGLDEVPVLTLPKVGIVVTGDELVQPGMEILPGQIFESNSFAIEAILKSYGIVPEVVRCKDSESETFEAVRKLSLSCDLLLSIGGVSVGARDFVNSAVDRAGYERLFSRVSMKPGKPVSFGLLPSGHAWIGLPGNPMSALTTFLLFAAPFLGHKQRKISIPLDDDFEVKGDRELFIPAWLNWRSNLSARVKPNVGSHSLSGFGDSDGLLRLAPGKHRKSTIAEFTFFPWRLAS